MSGRVRPAAQGPLEIHTLPAMTAMRQSCFCSIPCKLSESSYMELKGPIFSWNACKASQARLRSYLLPSADVGCLFPESKNRCGFKPICSGFCSSSSAPAGQQKLLKAAMILRSTRNMLAAMCNQ